MVASTTSLRSEGGEWRGRAVKQASLYLTTPLESTKYVTLASTRPSIPFPTPYSLRKSPLESLSTGYYEFLWSEPTVRRWTVSGLTVSFCALTKVCCSWTESGLMPITRRFDPLNTSLSVKFGSECPARMRKGDEHLPTSASLN